MIWLSGDETKTLLASGYKGPFNFEPFAAEHMLLDPKSALRASIDFIAGKI